MTMHSGKVVVAITGGSGAIYAQRFLMRAAEQAEKVFLILTEQAIQVIDTELDITLSRQNFSAEAFLGKHFDNIELLDGKNYFTPPASGSFQHDGMVIVPCSMGTAGRIANGISDDLITRSADVCLKEKRKLILVPREMPWNLIHLRNMTQLAEAGATILPACPAWYQKPATLEELADTVVARILQAMGFEQRVMKPWMDEDAG